MRLRIAPLITVVALASSTSFAHAEGTVDVARSEYEEGSSDLEANHYAAAADHFARADELAPNPMVLELALRAAVRADAGVLSMTLADRADARGINSAVAKEARARFRNRTGRIIVRCPEGASCSARIDERDTPNETPQWVVAGDHVVELTVNGHVNRKILRVDPSATLDVRPLALSQALDAKPIVKNATESKPAATRPIPTAVYPLGAGAVAGLAVWGYFGLSGLYGDPGLQSLKKCSPYCAQRDADSVHRKLILADLGFGVGAASVVAALIVFVTRRERFTTTAAASGPSLSFDPRGVFAGYTWAR